MNNKYEKNNKRKNGPEITFKKITLNFSVNVC